MTSNRSKGAGTITPLYCEEDMGSKNSNINGSANFSSEQRLPIHEFLGSSAEEIRADLLADGLDPRLEVAAMRRLGAVMSQRHRPAPLDRDFEREILAPSWQSKKFPRFEESVAAGVPAWSDLAKGPTGTSFLDILDRSDPRSVIWARVSGWSMRDIGINDGDTILVDTSIEPRDGDVVLAHIASSGQVVKRLRIQGDRALLESANPDFATIVVDDPANLKIHGVVVGRAGKI